MGTRAFAAKYRLNVQQDACGNPIISGKHGDIGEYGDGRLCACFWGGNPSKTRSRRIAATANAHIGQLIQRGGDEAQFAFDAADPIAARWFLRTLQLRAKRSIGQAHKDRLHRLSEAYSPIRRRAQSAPGATAGIRASGAVQAGQTTR